MLFKDFSGKPEEDGGYIVAYASTFDRDADLHGDVIAKGAFSDSLAEWEQSGKPIPLVFNHKFDDPEYNIGCVIEAKEDDHGLLIKAAFDPDNPKAQYVRKLVQEGRMWKMSFGSIIQDARQAELEDGTICREITKSKILEVSIVQIPANEHASILVVKSGEDTKTGKLHVITGAPCSGKSTYVREHRQSGDVVIDYDVIAQALGSENPHRAPDNIRRAAFAARRGAIESVLTSGAEAWVIHTTPNERDMARYLKAGADVITLDTDLDTCLQRAKDDNRPEGTSDAILEWFGETADGGINDADAAAPEPASDCAPVSKAYSEVLIKALAGFSQALTLRLTDAQGNVVSEIPLTAEFVASELESLSDQPADEPEVNSEDTPETQEGDSSADAGETGAPVVDEEFLAQFYQTLHQGEQENVSEETA